MCGGAEARFGAIARESREELRTPPPHATIDGAFTAGSAGVGSGAGAVEVEVQTEESGAQIVTCDVCGCL